MGTMTSDVVSVRARMGSIRQRRDICGQQIARQEGRLKAIEDEKAELLKAVGLIDRAIQVISANGIGRIESIVTGGLQLVFEDPTLGFSVEKTELTRGNSYKLMPYKGEVRGAAMDTFGGGVVNVIAFLLRMIMIKRFKLGKFLVLDETFNNVSAEYQPMVSSLLKKLSHEHGYTIFAVTHQPILAAAADNVYKLVPREGQSPVIVRLSPEERRLV